MLLYLRGIPIPSAGLRRGDLGAMVEIHMPKAFEIEFVAASGHTHALATLGVEHVRHIGGRDLIAVRSLEPDRANTA